MTLELHLTLKSDATFGRGDGVVGLVDAEVEHDAETGFPYIRGRVLKGLLVEECANLLFALRQQSPTAYNRFAKAAKFLFGQPGSTLEDDAALRVGPALLPEKLRETVAADVKAERRRPADVLESLTDIRRQTAVDEETGAPAKGSLRAVRVVLRETSLVARLDFVEKPSDDALALLSTCGICLRRGGTGRNRGRGRLEVRLCDMQGQDLTATHFARFQEAVRED
jgi:hypothetical protein